MFITSCEYEFIEIDQPDPDVPVSFSEIIIPIFSAKCTGCHTTGRTSPDLSRDNAFNSIVPEYIDTGTPGQSKIYTVPAPTSPHGGRYSTQEAAFVLTWIEQGAQNN